MIDLTTQDWLDTAQTEAAGWLNTTTSDESTIAEALGIDDHFTYDGTGYEGTILGLVMAACGTSDKPALFTFPEGLGGDLDLIGDGEGIIEFVRYVLYVPYTAPFLSAALTSPVTELDDTVDDRGLGGIDLAVDILVVAGRVFQKLITTYESIMAAVTR